jgi:hypothetical protein
MLLTDKLLHIYQYVNWIQLTLTADKRICCCFYKECIKYQISYIFPAFHYPLSLEHINKVIITRPQLTKTEKAFVLKNIQLYNVSIYLYIQIL